MKKALLIGINYFEDSGARLYGCINDAVSVKGVLIDAYGYKENNIIVLRDDVNDEFVEYKPTKENISLWLDRFASESVNCNEIWIHYSGHGTYMLDDDNGEEKDNRDEAIVPSNFRNVGFIRDDDLRNKLENFKCKTMITMDCCHSGSSWDLTYKFTCEGKRIYRHIENRKRMRNRNIYMLSGSRDDQTAADYFNFEERQPMGAFTMGLIKSMRDLNHNYKIYQLHNKVNEYLETCGFSQRCVLSASNPLPFVKVSRSNGNINNRYRNNLYRNNGYNSKRKVSTNNFLSKMMSF